MGWPGKASLEGLTEGSKEVNLMDIWGKSIPGGRNSTDHDDCGPRGDPPQREGNEQEGSRG